MREEEKVLRSCLRGNPSILNWYLNLETIDFKLFVNLCEFAFTLPPVADGVDTQSMISQGY